MDIYAGMAAFEAKHLEAPTCAGARGANRDLAPSRGGHSAGATDAERALLFVVEVQKVSGLEDSTLKFRGAREPRLFVNSKNELQRTVGNVGALHHRQGRCHTHSVVGSEGGTVGPQPIAIAQYLDGIGVEVVGRALVLLANHVEVALQQGLHRALATSVRRLPDNNVAGLVLNDLETQAGRLRQHILACGSLLGRAARYRRERVKVFPNWFGFQLCKCRYHDVLRRI